MDPYDEKTRLNESIQECKRSPSQTKGQFRTKTKVAFVIAGLTIGICVLLGVCSYQAVYIYGNSIKVTIPEDTPTTMTYSQPLNYSNKLPEKLTSMATSTNGNSTRISMSTSFDFSKKWVYRSTSKPTSKNKTSTMIAFSTPLKSASTLTKKSTTIPSTLTTRRIKDLCSVVKVIHTIHWRNGDTGQYFYINEHEVEEMLGYADWGGKEFDVIQTGSRKWSGSVVIWKSGSNSAAHGRRIEESAAKQWAAGDTIKLQICQRCHQVDVVHTDHWRTGDTGQYFYFSETEFDKLVGRRYWDNKKFDVIQKGSRLWTGEIIAWKGSKTSGAHGRRTTGSAAGQWAFGDTIELQSCQE